MEASVEKVSLFGQPAMKAANDELAFVIVPNWGSNLISLVDKRVGHELLRVPRGAEEFWRRPFLFGIPILFPPNRIEDGRFTYRSRHYQFDVNEAAFHNHIHGFVHNRPWEVLRAEVEQGGGAVVVTQFDAADHEDVMRQFPHRFIIKMRYSLDGCVLHKIAEVSNEGSEPLPLGLGFHTCFQFPEKTAHFALTAAKRWRLNERMLPTGELEEIRFKGDLQAGMSLDGVALDDAFLANVAASGVEDGGSLGQASDANAATLRLPSVGVHIRYRADANFKHWVVYNGGGRSGFICPEPYTWVTNAPNLDLPAALTGLQELPGGESRTFATSITIVAPTEAH